MNQEITPALISGLYKKLRDLNSDTDKKKLEVIASEIDMPTLLKHIQTCKIVGSLSNDQKELSVQMEKYTELMKDLKMDNFLYWKDGESTIDWNKLDSFIDGFEYRQKHMEVLKNG